MSITNLKLLERMEQMNEVLSELGTTNTVQHNTIFEQAKQNCEEISTVKKQLTGNGDPKEGLIYKQEKLQDQFEEHKSSNITIEDIRIVIAESKVPHTNGKFMSAATKDLIIRWGMRLAIATVAGKSLLDSITK